MPRMKRTSLNPGGRDELNDPPHHPSGSGGSGSSPRRSVEGTRSSKIRKLPRRMSLEILSSSGKGKSSEGVDGIETDSDIDPGTNIVLFIDESEVSD